MTEWAAVSTCVRPVRSKVCRATGKNARYARLPVQPWWVCDSKSKLFLACIQFAFHFLYFHAILYK